MEAVKRVQEPVRSALTDPAPAATIPPHGFARLTDC